jgi:hypothetical protein
MSTTAEDQKVRIAYRLTISMRLREETLCAISAAKLLLCINRRSSSLTLYTKNFLRPFGRRWRVYGGDMRIVLVNYEPRKHLLVAAVADLGLRNENRPGRLTNCQAHLRHGQLALEPPTDTVVDTLRLPPCLLHAVVAVGLVAPAWARSGWPAQEIACRRNALEGLRALLDDFDGGSHCELGEQSQTRFLTP